MPAAIRPSSYISLYHSMAATEGSSPSVQVPSSMRVAPKVSSQKMKSFSWATSVEAA